MKRLFAAALCITFGAWLTHATTYQVDNGYLDSASAYTFADSLHSGTTEVGDTLRVPLKTMEVLAIIPVLAVTDTLQVVYERSYDGETWKTTSIDTLTAAETLFKRIRNMNLYRWFNITYKKAGSDSSDVGIRQFILRSVDSGGD